ncbi:FAD-dependent oxidoreductase, partial [Mycobacterium tuberculosis]|nr:FAD-dependent oxidoreductase [Mycobacterium tuberculosis]
YSSPGELEKMGAAMKMRHAVTAIDSNSKTLTAHNLETGEEVVDTYDKLIMTTGSWPIVPPIEGINLENIVLSKNYQHANT